MVDDSPPGPSGVDAHRGADRLNSWKEIAAYLGKGVRTVQRWETQMGLPVRRLGREGGEIVYALRNEIDAWILNAGPTRDAEETARSEPPAESPPPPRAPVPPGTRLTIPRRAWAILALLALVGSAMTLVRRPGGAPGREAGNPVGAAFEAGTLRAWDGEGRPLWESRIEAQPDQRLDTRIGLDPGRDDRRIAVEDLDGDGRNEVMLILVSTAGTGDSLHVFNADGTTRFIHLPGRPVTWGSKVFRGFNAYTLHLLREPDGSLGLWVTSGQVSWFPSLLQRLSPRGELLSEYWSNGTIRSVRPAIIKGRRYLLVGAYNNEHRGASLTFLDLERPSGTAPAENPKYRCLDCADGEPAEFLVFPGSDVLKEVSAGEGSAVVADARLTGDDEVVVTVHQAGAMVAGETDAVLGDLNYTFSVTDLRLKEMVPLWGFLKIHKAFETARRLNHAFGPEEVRQLSGVLRWSRGRFVPLGDAAGEPVFARVRETAGARTGL